MNLFARKIHLFCISNLMLSFVCTGFLGINGFANRIGSTTGEAHEISLTASDTEPVSHYGEGENSLAFITESLEAVITQQEDAIFPDIEGEENEFAFITESIEAVIVQQENALADKKVEKKTTVKKSTSKKTTSVVTKKEVNKSTSYTKPTYSSVTGDAIVIIDSDMQDPPELIPEMLKLWEQGNDVIYCNCDDDAVSVACSNHNTILKNTDWFKINRQLPSAWVA